MSHDNLLLLTDSYKVSHYKQYPPDAEIVYSFFESRGGTFPEVLFFGLQYFLTKYLAGVQVTPEKITEAEEFWNAHLGPDAFNRAGWEHILTAHKGYLPVKIRARREGSLSAPHTVLMTVENTDPQVPWLTNYLETLLSQVWYPSTVATQSHAMKLDLLAALERSGTPELVDFKLHDFGFRGSTSVESSGLGGCAHLVNFKGTDTASALTMAREFYHCPMAGFSIPAAEHSTITSWGREHEVDAFRNMLTAFPEGLVAVVSDSYDIYHACDLWGGELKADVLARNGTLVVRPDSGDPPVVVVEVLRKLGASFGETLNTKGFLVLNDKVRVIQGDGIDPPMMNEVIAAVHGAGYSMDNLAFGSGGGLLQRLNRDTCKFAFKCSAIRRAGVWHDVYKDPITDPGKSSKKGRFDDVELITVFENGVQLRQDSLATIRDRAAR